MEAEQRILSLVAVGKAFFFENANGEITLYIFRPYSNLNQNLTMQYTHPVSNISKFNFRSLIITHTHIQASEIT